jgi:hypothetical protein
MKTLKNISIIILAILMQACFSDFEETNTDPNAINEVKSDLLLTSITFNTVAALNTEAFVFTAEIMNQNLLDSRNPNDVGLLNFRARGPWRTLYTQLADVELALVSAKEANLINQEAALKVLRSWIYSTLTNLYGDIPYSELLNTTEENLLPSYDLQENIYPNILSELEDANNLFDENSDPVAGDIIFDGDILKWKKFCNSLRLRLLMRVVDVNGLNAANQISNIVSDASNNPIMESNGDNALLDYNGDNESIYSISNLSNFTGYYGSELMINTLLGFGDTRLDVFFDPSVNSVQAGTPEYKGWVFGQNNLTADLSSTDDSFADRAIRDGIIMTYTELQFILAEVAQRGIIANNAETYYNNAITSSFEYWNASLPSGYLTQNGVLYDDALETILLQKWLAGFTTPYETWFDYRRTGLPDIPIDPDAGLNSLPLRFGYPDSEISLNATNYNAAVVRIGEDEPTTSMWILQ